MKLNWLVLCGTVVSMNLLAQEAATPPAAAQPGAAESTTAVSNAPAATPAPAAKHGKRKATHPAAAKKKDPAAELRTVPLVPGPAVVDANHVNVRGQAKLKSEVVTRLNKGEPVSVIEEIVKNNSAADEPSAWAKIALPTNVNVWVHSSFIDPANQTVKPRKLNVRTGPGENYSVLGMLYRGEQIKPLNTKGTWLEIQAPTNAYAFIAAQFLKQEPATSVASTTPAPAEPAPEAATVTEPPAVAAPPTEAPVVAAPPAEPSTNATPPAQEPAVASTESTTNAPAEAAAEEPPPKRIVLREGVVRGTVSIQAPTGFGLYSLQNGRLMDYLYTTSPYLDLRRYKGLHIIVTGEEGLEERWGNTPVITIQKIQTLDD